MKLKLIKFDPVLLITLTLITFGLFYVFTDEPTGRVEAIKGIVSKSYVVINKQNSGSKQCEISFGNGQVLREQCFAKTGDTILVCKQNMKRGGVKYYANGCLP